MIRGTCLCGGVRFEIDRATGPFELCHCNRCRKVSGSAFLAGVMVRVSDFRLTSGHDCIRSYDAPILDHPPAYRSNFCERCGAPVPLPSEGSEWVEVPAGLLEDDPGLRPDKHIYVDYQGPWHEIADDLPQFTKSEIGAHRMRAHRAGSTAVRSQSADAPAIANEGGGAAPRRTLFEAFLRGARPHLVRDYGVEAAAVITTSARVEFERVRSEVPDIGGARNVFFPVLVVVGWLIAFHRAMLAAQQGAADTIRVSQAVIDGWLRILPGFLLRAFGWIALSAPVRRYFRGQARRSQRREFPQDFVWSVETRADGEMSLVFDECAVNKWFDAADVRDLKPYCNFVDVTYSRLMGMGVDASETIGLGCEQCALRFKHGRETEIPPSLRGLITGD